MKPTRRFVREEIGYAFEYGPSLNWTCHNLERLNRAALRQLGTAAPERVTYPLRTKYFATRDTREAKPLPRTWIPRNVREGRRLVRSLLRFFRGGAA